MVFRSRFVLACGVVLFAMGGAAAAQTFVCGKARGAERPLTAATRYASGSAGFDLVASPTVQNGACSATGSFYFSAPLAEGNYRVEVELGGPEAAVTTVKAEARRLMLLNVHTAAGAHTVERFAVNIRTTALPGGGNVRIKPREVGSLRWDDKLTLEFAGTHPSVRRITVTPAPSIPTVYLAGDSTVVDQDKEPWAAWGQVLPLFFTDAIAVANHAESGETIASSESELRFQKIFSTLRRGDYLFMQFGHNDQKPGKGYVPAATTYSDLTRKYVAMARERGATPVLVTSMNRRTFDSDGHITDTLAPYPQTVRSLAEETHSTLIDLNACSKTLYEAVCEPHSRELFVYAPANTYPDQPEALHDDTHFNSFGAYELARCVVRGIQQSDLPLRKSLRSGVAVFDPAHPDAPSAATIPASPAVAVQTPYGR
ncbi:rhamnogalacturonan acetylesterase [Terriglobus aquaticus]|uniref:Rhamnogalacturonan acetylesterase n=1 Tax=Terriglobus aquaticus TaxID=940139 RepID=A0ABW9KNI7_9BACT|nr:rhamnogalacturonan acetylesterase [Terriglobus aquaticus]